MKLLLQQQHYLAFLTLGFLVGIVTQVSASAGTSLAVAASCMIGWEAALRVRAVYTQQSAKQLRQIEQTYQQIEALHQIFTIIHISKPIPKMRGWAASPDVICILLKQILARQRPDVFEFGCGTSTILLGLALKKLGGRLTAVEHNTTYANQIRKALNEHELNDICTIIVAPLTQMTVGARRFLFYDCIEALSNLNRNYDLVFIDGPPGITQADARYPALPVISQHLANGATVVLDDAARHDEQEIIDAWRKAFPELDFTYVETEKGAAIFQRMV